MEEHAGADTAVPEVTTIVERLRVLARASQAHLATRADGAGINPLDFSALMALVAAGSMTQGELGYALGIGRSTVSGMVDRLHARRLIARHADQRDRRLVILTPSAEAKALSTEQLGPLRLAIFEVVEALSDADRQAVETFLGRLNDILDAALEGRQPRSVAPRIKARSSTARSPRPRL